MGADMLNLDKEQVFTGVWKIVKVLTCSVMIKNKSIQRGTPKNFV